MPNFTFTRDIPDAPNNPSQDQPIMQVNSNSTDSILNVDHYGFNLADGGLHRQSTYPNQTTPASTPAQAVLYSKSGAFASEIWMVRDGDVGTDVALTTSKIGNASALQNGISWLPGGILIQWGTVTPVVNQTLTGVAFPVAFPNACFVVTTSIARTSSRDNVDQVYINAKTAGNFAYYATTSGTGFASFDWIAIGN